MSLHYAWKVNPARFTCLLLAVVFGISAAGAQIVPARPKPPELAVFGEFSLNRPHWNPDPAHYGVLYGDVAGAYLQTRPWLGIETRALWLESADQPDHEEHQRAIFFGPRIEFGHRRISMDGIVLGGVSHSDYPMVPVSTYPRGQDVLIASTAPAMEAGGGLNLRLSPRISWKIGEVIYGRSFSANQPQGTTFSSGIAVMLFR